MASLLTPRMASCFTTRRAVTRFINNSIRIPSIASIAPVAHVRFASSPAGGLHKTPLYELHVQHAAKLVPFASYSMPLLYPSQSHSVSHQFTREHASIFDVSHMVQHLFSGPGALAFLESLTPSDLASLSPFSSTLSVLLAEPTGGILDDLIITMQASQEQFYVVTNAGCRDKDLAHFAEKLREWEEAGKPEVLHKTMDDYGLIALQGPEAKDILRSFLHHVMAPGTAPELDEVLFGQSIIVQVPAGEKVHATIPIHIARGGYTGEDGFEISIPPAPKGVLTADAPNPSTYITQLLLKLGGPEKVQMAGLAARDSLRLEAGLCLYGHDLAEDITPPEAALSWVVAKRRRAEGGFPGAEVINAMLAKGGPKPERRRVGLEISGGPPAREGVKIFSSAEGGEEIGKVTSGGPAISLGMKPIAMGYVKHGFEKAGTPLAVEIRGKMKEANVVKMPFVPTKYWKGKQ